MLFNPRILKVRFLSTSIAPAPLIPLNSSAIYSSGNTSFLFTLLAFLASLIYSCTRTGKVTDNCGSGPPLQTAGFL